jgi:uncharacterized membrane protein YbhN (UPF0104 family)
VRRKVGFLLVWGLVVFLLWLALKDVSWHDLGTLLSRLQAVQILVLLLVNSLIILLLGARWWLILKVQGHRIPFLAAAGYRLAAFSVSYLTPGPAAGNAGPATP